MRTTGGALRREAGLGGLLLASMGGIIGSGWLFGPLHAAQMAGPASLIAWAIGGAAVMLLGFVYAELVTAFPRAGAVIALPKLSHGPMLATVMSWVVLLGYLAAAPAEATAVVTYANNFVPGLVRGGGTLNGTGFAAAVLLLGLFAAINMMAIRLVLRVNGVVTLFKIAVPTLTALAFLGTKFSPGNFTAHGFAPHGAQGVFAAVAGSGVIYAYTGFRQAIELAGESRRPRRDLPVAIIGSVLIGFVLYAVLQIALIGAIPPHDLAQGWARLNFIGLSGPFAGLATLAGMSWLAVVLYLDSAISPAGTAIISFASTPRLLFATGHEGLTRLPLGRLSRHGVPVIGVLITFAVGVLFLLPLPSWRAIIKVVSAAALLSYGMASVSLITLRRTAPLADYPRPFTLAFGVPLAGLAFIVANCIIVWTGAHTATMVMSYVLTATLLYLLVQGVRHRGLGHVAWRGVWWLVPYFAGLWGFAQLGPSGLTKGSGFFSDAGLMVGIALFSIVILALASASGLADPAEARQALRDHFSAAQ
jgi:amino acid transporter